MKQKSPFNQTLATIKDLIYPNRILTRAQATKCPICRSHRTQIVALNTLRNGVKTPIHECKYCSHKFCYPLPAKEEVLSWYQGIRYFDMNCRHQGINMIEHSEEWAPFVKPRMKVFDEQVAPYFSDESLIVAEIGCLEGMMLKELSRRGHTVIGLESNAEVVERSRTANKIDIRVCDIEAEEPHVQAHAVLSFHTFEHLRDPRGATAKAARMLRPGGVLLLELPCDDDEMNNPDHFHFFNEWSLRKMVSTYFRDVKTIPKSYARDGGKTVGSLYVIGQKL